MKALEIKTNNKEEFYIEFDGIKYDVTQSFLDWANDIALFQYEYKEKIRRENEKQQNFADMISRF